MEEIIKKAIAKLQKEVLELSQDVLEIQSEEGAVMRARKAAEVEREEAHQAYVKKMSDLQVRYQKVMDQKKEIELKEVELNGAIKGLSQLLS